MMGDIDLGERKSLDLYDAVRVVVSNDPALLRMDALRNTLNSLSKAQDRGFGMDVWRPMITQSIYESLKGAYGSDITKYADDAFRSLKNEFAMAPKDVQELFSDVELRRMVGQMIGWQHQVAIVQQQYANTPNEERTAAFYKAWEQFKLKTIPGYVSIVEDIVQDTDSPENRFQEMSKYLQDWASFPAFGFGVPMLDNATGGTLPGEICVLTGAPGTMKTSLALAMVDNFVTHVDKGLVYYCTVDMPPWAITMRVIERESSVPETTLMDLRVNNYPEYMAMGKKFTGKYGNRLYIGGHEKKKPMDIRRLLCECLTRQPQLVVVDYMTRLKANGQSDFEAVEQAMPLILEFAHEYQTSFLLLSQMSRLSRSEQASGKLGGHGKGGGIVEELAHTEIELFKQQDPDNSMAQPLVIAAITKARRGISGQYFSLEYDGPIKRFTGNATRMVKAKSAQRTVFEKQGGFY